jgi:archaellum component FlaD/FlaE
MLENIGRMFGSNDDDTTEEPTDEADNPPANPESEAPGSDPETPDEDWNPDGEDGNEDEGPDVQELDVRLDELDEELSSTESSVRALQNSQEEMADSIDEMNDTVRQLVGVYDRLAAEKNPFVDDPDEATNGASPMPVDSGGPVADTDPTPDERTRNGESEVTEDSVVSFDDLQEESADSTDREAELAAEPAVPASEHEHDSLSEDPGRRTAEDGAAQASPSDDGGPVLESIPDGYAGEVLVMEWLATLMDRSGPAGAFRAVDYYENVGWISPAVEERLVDVIGGPALDVFVDPTQPREPTAEEHAVSHEYLRVMARIDDI